MKTRLFSTLLLLPALSPGAEAPSGNIQFSTRDQLTGTATAISKERIVWSSPLLDHPAPFFLNKVQELNLSATIPENTAGYEAVVALTNGDVLRGQLASVSDKEVQLDTWYAGHIVLSRVMVESVRIEDRPKLLFHGPDSIDGWTMTDRSGDRTGAKPWAFENGGLQSKGAGGIGRDVGLPDLCRIAFTVDWRSEFHLKLNFCGAKFDTVNPGSCYELAIQRRYANLRKRTALGGGMPVGQSPSSMPDLSESENARVELCMDRKKGVFNLFIDGHPAALWNDPDPKTHPTDGGIQFVSDTAGYSTKISRIEITPWDGQTEEPVDPDNQLNPFGPNRPDGEEKEPKPKEPEAGRMLLRNGDSLAGELVGISDGIITVKTRFGDVKLPAGRLKTVALKPVELETPKIRDGDIRAWFADGSRVVFRLDSASLESLTGYSQNFGTATFKTSAFSRIEFNLYDPVFQDLRGEKAW